LPSLHEFGRIRDVTLAAGFTKFRVAAQTPFNLVFELRK